MEGVAGKSGSGGKQVRHNKGVQSETVNQPAIVAKTRREKGSKTQQGKRGRRAAESPQRTKTMKEKVVKSGPRPELITSKGSGKFAIEETVRKRPESVGKVADLKKKEKDMVIQGGTQSSGENQSVCWPPITKKKKVTACWDYVLQRIRQPSKGR